MNFNKAVLIGNLTRDPELRTLPSGQNVANFSIATNRYWRDKDGNRKEDTQFHNIVAFGRLADLASKYLAKGSMVMIEGRIQNRSYDDKSGQKRYISEIVAESMQLGPRRSGAGPAGEPTQAASTAPETAPEIPVISEDEETPKASAKRKTKNEKEKSKDDEFDIEEDIPF